MTYRRRVALDGGALVVATGTAALASLIAGSGSVSALERWVFHAINDLPDLLYRPMWTLQFAGLLLSPLIPFVVALALKRWRLAAALILLIPAKLLLERHVL